jgi:hypothetical protein
MHWSLAFMTKYVAVNGQQDCTLSRCVIDDAELRFNILADFGGQATPPYNTVGQKMVNR